MIPQRMRLGVVLALTGVGLVSVVLSGMFGGRLPALGGALWIANLLGWCAYVLLLLLFLLPLRRRQLGLPPLIALSAHRRAGYLMLALVVAHVVVSLLGERETSAYWLPTAPLYMLLGQASLVALVALCWIAARSVRTRQPGVVTHFPATHLLLSYLVLALSFAHAAGSAAIPFSPWRMLPWAILSAVAALLPLRPALRSTPRL